MMFGTPAAAAPPPAKNQTMMFGAPASNPAPPTPAPPPSSSRTTVMFGTPGSNNVQVPPLTAPPPSAKATMVFGAPVAIPAPPAKNQTMMFGTPASNAAPPPAPPPSASSKQTMVFGSAPASSPAASSKQTMVFGTVASNSAASQPAPVSSAKQTMVFGSAAPPPPAKNQTMMFGTPASNVVAEPVEETILEQPGQSARTVLFGSPVIPPEPVAAAPRNTTMMFGKPAAIPKVTAGVVELAGMSADEGAPNESTVRVDAAQVIQEHGASENENPQVNRHDRTQRFAMSDAGGPTPPEGQSQVKDRHNRTQQFAMSSDDPSSSVFVGDTTLPPGAMPVVDRANRGGSDLNTTLPPDVQLDPPGVSVLHDPANMTPPEATQAAEGPVATTLANLPVMGERPVAPFALELPPEPVGSPRDLRAPIHPPSQQLSNEDAAALRAARGGGAGRAIVVILIIVAIALAGVLVYRLFGRELLGKVAPVGAIRATEQALATLRFDDQASQEKAVAQLMGVLAEHPTLPETQGALVIASALRYDDVQGEVTRAAASLRSLKSNGAPQARVAELEAKIAANQITARNLKSQLEAAVVKLQALMQGIEAGTSAHLAMLRADGLARGVLGDAEAIAQAVAFRQGTSADLHDDWAELIEPEYALNGGSSLDEAITQLIALRARGANSTFLRAYVLLARLQLKKGDADQAREELEQVTTMNSRHEIARDLLASLGAP